jgi:hypothetical protein
VISMTPQPGPSIEDDGAFNWSEWRQLRRIIQAGAAYDAAQFRIELLDLDRQFPMSGRGGAYLWFSLRYQVAKQLQRFPTSADLAQLSKTIHDRFTRLVTVPEKSLNELLQVVFEFREATDSSGGSSFVINGAAALSLLVQLPDDLDEVEPHLVQWYNQNSADFAALNPPE